MSKLSIANAEKLFKLLNGEPLPSSSLKGELCETLISENIIQKNGRSRQTLSVNNPDALKTFLFRELGINDLAQYISELKDSESITRSDLVKISNDTKTTKVRTFKGFLVNVLEPIKCTLNGKEIVISPTDGLFTFVADFERFAIPDDIIIIGVENAENFRYIHSQQYLFSDFKCLFVSRYPQNQSNDLRNWLTSIPNNYLHFGDFDFGGLNIFVNEFKKYLGKRAKFFVPENLESLFEKYGNRNLYYNQQIAFTIDNQDDEVKYIYALIEKYQKGLEQEALIEK